MEKSIPFSFFYNNKEEILQIFNRYKVYHSCVIYDTSKVENMNCVLGKIVPKENAILFINNGISLQNYDNREIEVSFSYLGISGEFVDGNVINDYGNVWSIGKLSETTWNKDRGIGPQILEKIKDLYIKIQSSAGGAAAKQQQQGKGRGGKGARNERKDGKSKKVFLLGRDRIVVKEGRKQFIRYQNKLISLVEARKLEKKK